MLKTSLLIISILNIITKDIRLLFLIFIIISLYNLKINRNMLNCIKRLKFLIYIYLFMLLLQIYYHQQGYVLLKISGVYITKEGILNFGIIFLRVINFLLISWIINIKNILPKYFLNYNDIIEEVMELIPQVFKIFKDKKEIKWVFRYILNRLKRKK